MKLFKYCILGFAAAAMVSACSDDSRENGGNGLRPETGDGVYMELSIEFPQSGSRSQTVEPGGSNDGTEIGTTAENTIQSVAIVLANSTTNGFIAASTVGVNGDGSVNTDLTFTAPSNSARAIAKINKSNLSTYYSNTQATAENTRPVNVFVFCNPTQDLINTFNNANVGDTDWLDLVCQVIENGTTQDNTGIWGANNFLMSNKFIATRFLPLTLADWDNYKTRATAFDLSGLNNSGQLNEIDNSERPDGTFGAIDVQRVMARFDFKDGSTLGNHKYHVVDVKDADSPNDPEKVHNLIDVQLTDMAFANMCNKFYYLPRTSDNGLPTGAQICGRETPTNYLVGPYATTFAGAAVMSSWDTYYNYPFFNANYATQYNSANWNWKALNGYDKEDYKFWRYSTENLIPGEVKQQRKGITTTVVFKGKMIADEWAKDADPDKYPDVAEMYKYINNVGGILKTDANENPILYSYNGNLYITWNSVKDAAIQASVDFTDPEKPVYSRYNPFYIAVFGSGGVGTYTVKIKGEEKTFTDELAQDPNSPNYLWEQWQSNKSDQNAKNKMRDAMVAATFTLYETSNDANGVGYYCYYFYYNRHNDNLQPGTMGPMEFCVVRNNVYKLAVTKLSKLGHPLRPNNDPDDPKPDDPDESDDIYLTVTCRVLPWVVRINNIEF